MTAPQDDDEKIRWVWPHPADMGTIAIAAVFLVATVWVLAFVFSSPEPVRDLFGKKPAEAQSNEVTIDLQQK